MGTNGSKEMDYMSQETLDKAITRHIATRYWLGKIHVGVTYRDRVRMISFWTQNGKPKTLLLRL